jgi:hypothetical protein
VSREKVPGSAVQTQGSSVRREPEVRVDPDRPFAVDGLQGQD